MKRIAALAMAVLLAGCATNPEGSIGLALLEQPSNLRGDRDFTQDLVQIQRAVFKHQAVCNPEVKFSVDTMNPNFARVTKPVTPSHGLGEHPGVAFGAHQRLEGHARSCLQLLRANQRTSQRHVRDCPAP